MKIHEKYINRCIEIAKKGLGSTAPNPMVGCVIVSNNTIIAEGYTSPYGGNHAEVNAINSVSDKSLLKQATLYVTLEPCSHYGKTPPCSDLIIKSKIPKVIIGCVDDNPNVGGEGIKKLKDTGIEVIVGVLKNKCKNHHKRFFTFHNKKRPYVILKWAETKDGFIAPESKNTKRPVWITNPFSKQLVHKWRSEEQAILVGTNTVVEDNPMLTTRSIHGKSPIRIVIDKNKTLQDTYHIFNEAAETIIISNDIINFKDSIAPQICDYLYSKNINSVIIEGGANTLQQFIDTNMWDEARVFTGDAEFKKGIKAPKLKAKIVSEYAIHSDNLKIYLND